MIPLREFKIHVQIYTIIRIGCLGYSEHRHVHNPVSQSRRKYISLVYGLPSQSLQILRLTEDHPHIGNMQ